VKPLALDLFCGLGGWTEGLLAEGYDVIGVDIERHAYGDEKYPAWLMLADVLTLHGAAFRKVDLIVASPPCTQYSYMAMPWNRGKQIARALRGQDVFPDGYKGSRTVEELNALFNACFRIQREASEAKGEQIPMVVENVRGAQPWVGRAIANYGSFYLWGDLPALMPNARAVKVPTMGSGWYPPDHPKHQPGLAFNGHAAKLTRRTDPGLGARFTSRDCGAEGTKQGGDWFGDPNSFSYKYGSKHPARKAASARIAKIPFRLSQWIARYYLPERAA
jgi:hypothetical protein